MAIEWRFSKNVQSLIEPDGGVLLAIRAGRYYAINGSAAKICLGIKSGQGLASMSEEISQSTGIAVDLIRSHILSFVKRLKELHLVEDCHV